MSKNLPSRPFILTIAGFDPSGGAGLLADIKTIENNGGYGLAVQTALTIQTDIEFNECVWTTQDLVLAQITALCQRFPIAGIKIGIIKSPVFLVKVIHLLRQHTDAPIVWDCVLKASTGFDFHTTINQDELSKVLEIIDVITPNMDELQALRPGHSITENIDWIKSQTNLYLKGGHRLDEIGVDEFYLKNGEKIILKPSLSNCSEKHGSGCILSAALATCLSLTQNTRLAAQQAKRYTEERLSSNSSLLAFHS